jgi:hypothetical protein
MVLLGNAVVFCTNAAEPTSAGSRRSNIDNGNLDRVREYMRSATYFPDYTIRLYYRADCKSTNGLPVPFPAITVEAPAKGQTGLAAARHIFRNARNVVIREDPGRIIRIWIGDVPTAILQTRIRAVQLNRHARETKLGAVEAILETKEVQAAMKNLGVGTPSYASSESAISPPPYPSEMKNVTFDEALDVIAKAWDGILIYGACTQPDKSGTKLFDVEAGNRVFF